jgi:hypothetical protein
MTAHIAHHSATSLMLPMPEAGSLPKRMPIPWNIAEPYKGMGFRNVLSQTKARKYELSQYPINGAAQV